MKYFWRLRYLEDCRQGKIFQRERPEYLKRTNEVSGPISTVSSNYTTHELHEDPFSASMSDVVNINIFVT